LVVTAISEIMKRFIFIFPLILSTLWLFASGNHEPKLNSALRPERWEGLINDTTLKSLLKITPYDLTIVPPSSGVQYYKDGIIYLASSKSEQKMPGQHLSFGKAYTHYAVLKDSVIESTSLFSSSFTFTLPCEAVTFSRDYKTMFFTLYSEGDGVEKIYQARFSGGKDNQGDWSADEIPLGFCTGKSTYTHPALSADGKILIFASNRPGTIGGMDLFISQNEGGAWSDPVNIGDAVNSTSNELFPYLDAENNLYFSSDGILGYGGYDVYVCKFKSNTWGKPINLSAPVNTEFDDVAFTVDRKNGKSAFYTVKQTDGLRSQQLFRVTASNESAPNQLTLAQYFTNPAATHLVILVKEPPVEATKTDKTEVAEYKGKGDVVVYRVQFLTSFNPKTRTQITMNGKEYRIFEYLYSGAYRLCIGEFSNYSQAKDLQATVIKNNYPQATVVAFVNDVRSVDPELYKETAVSEISQAADKPEVKQAITVTKPEEIKTVAAAKEAVVKPSQEKAAEVTKETKAVVTPPKTVETKIEEPKPSVSEVKKDIIVYRVQIATNTKSVGSIKVTISGKSYSSYEYVYMGAYRTCVGEFSTLGEASKFQSQCRQSGYPQAFVVVFKNNTRSTDPSFFR